MAKFESPTLTWLSQRNAENWVIENSKLIEKLKEASGMLVDVCKFLRNQGYKTKPSRMKVLKKGEAYGIVQRTFTYPVHYAKIELTDLGLELYKTMLQLGKIIHK